MSALWPAQMEREPDDLQDENRGDVPVGGEVQSSLHAPGCHGDLTDTAHRVETDPLGDIEAVAFHSLCILLGN
jgi:hypothetical protein